MNKAQKATCAECSKCKALINNYYLVTGVCVWCKAQERAKGATK